MNRQVAEEMQSDKALTEFKAIRIAGVCTRE